MKSVPSTQENVPIAGVKDGIIILKDGQYRLVLEVTAVNFSLKSEEEQNSLVLQYQGFLNSIHFPIEIIVRSKRLDLAPYINKIKGLAEKQNNELLRIQTTDYVDFVGQLINLANIMKKTFYVVIGYQPLNVGQGTILDKLLHRKQSADLKISDEEFLHNTKEIMQRGQNVAQGLGSMGLHCKQLTTEEIIELFYGIYNPEVAGKERLTEAENVSSAFVTSSQDEGKTNQSVDLKTNSEQAAIDNKALVLEQEKNKAQERAFENQSQEQRSIGMTAPGAIPKATGDAASPKTQDTNSPTSAWASTSDRHPSRDGSAETGKQNPSSSNQAPNLSPANAPNGANPANTTSNISRVNQATDAGPNPDQNKTVQQQVSDPKINKDYGW